jgi:signal transduction histidine kinase
MLDDLGLEAAAQWLVRDLRARSDLEIELDVSTVDGEPFGRLGPALEIGLFRVAQEGLNNAIKHAQASRVVVVLVRDTDAIRLRVIDDGKGLSGGSGASTSLGLLGMRERLAAWDASVSIDNGAYGGVVVSADVPLAPADALSRAA